MTKKSLAGTLFKTFKTCPENVAGACISHGFLDQLAGTLFKTFKIILWGHGSGGILSGLAIRLWRENESPVFHYDLHRPRSISGDLGMFIKS